MTAKFVDLRLRHGSIKNLKEEGVAAKIIENCFFILSHICRLKKFKKRNKIQVNRYVLNYDYLRR